MRFGTDNSCLVEAGTHRRPKIELFASIALQVFGSETNVTPTRPFVPMRSVDFRDRYLRGGDWVQKVFDPIYQA